MEFQTCFPTCRGHALARPARICISAHESCHHPLEILERGDATRTVATHLCARAVCLETVVEDDDRRVLFGLRAVSTLGSGVRLVASSRFAAPPTGAGSMVFARRRTRRRRLEFRRRRAPGDVGSTWRVSSPRRERPVRLRRVPLRVRVVLVPRRARRARAALGRQRRRGEPRRPPLTTTTRAPPPTNASAAGSASRTNAARISSSPPPSTPSRAAARRPIPRETPRDPSPETSNPSSSAPALTTSTSSSSDGTRATWTTRTTRVASNLATHTSRRASRRSRDSSARESATRPEWTTTTRLARVPTRTIDQTRATRGSAADRRRSKRAEPSRAGRVRRRSRAGVRAESWRGGPVGVRPVSAGRARGRRAARRRAILRRGSEIGVAFGGEYRGWFPRAYFVFQRWEGGNARGGGGGGGGGEVVRGDADGAGVRVREVGRVRGERRRRGRTRRGYGPISTRFERTFRRSAWRRRWLRSRGSPRVRARRGNRRRRDEDGPDHRFVSRGH